MTQLAAGLGYQVATEPTAPPAHAAAVVCASHGRDEEETLAAALEAGVGYVGLVASRKRGEQVVAGLEVGRQGAGAHLPGSTSEPGRHRRWRCRSWPRSWRSGANTAARSGGRRRPSPTSGPGSRSTRCAACRVVAVETSLHLDHDGTRYWFCGSGCLRAFAADPAGYLARDRASGGLSRGGGRAGPGPVAAAARWPR